MATVAALTLRRGSGSTTPSRALPRNSETRASSRIRKARWTTRSQLGVRSRSAICSHIVLGLTYCEFHQGPIGTAYASTLGGQIDNVLSSDEWIARLATLPLIDQPGVAFRYGASTDLLGVLLARIEGTTLGAVLRQRLLDPMGLHDTDFVVPHDKHHRRDALTGFDGSFRPATLVVATGSHALAERHDDVRVRQPTKPHRSSAARRKSRLEMKVW